MPEIVLASTSYNNIKGFVASSNNCFCCNITKCLSIKKNGTLSFNLSDRIGESVRKDAKIVFVFKKMSGNGLISITSFNYMKDCYVANNSRVEVPYSNNIIINRPSNAIGDVVLMAISFIYTSNKNDTQTTSENISKDEANRKTYIERNQNVVSEKKGFAKSAKFIRTYDNRKKMGVVNNPKLHNVNYDNILSGSKAIHEHTVNFAFNTFYDELFALDDSEFYRYGGKTKVLNDMTNISFSIIKTLKNLKVEDCKYLVFDYAGIGDAIHSRLVVQQLARDGKVCWVVPPLVYELYRDDDVATMYKGFTILYRITTTKLCQILCRFIDLMINTLFKEYHIFNMTNAIVIHDKNKQIKVEKDFEDFYFKANGLERNFKIKHKLIHNEKLSDLDVKFNHNKYVVIEYASFGYGCLDLNIYDKLIDNLNDIGIDCCFIGSINDKPLNKGIDCRGMNLYNTATLIKNSIGFVGRNSGNQCMTVFFKKIPVFEISTPTSLRICNYRDNITSLTKDNFADEIKKYYGR